MSETLSEPATDHQGRPLRLIQRGKFPPVWEFDPFDYDGANPINRNAMGLTEFDIASRAEIGMAVQEPRPPDRMIRLGHAQIPSRAWYEWHWWRGIDPDTKRRSISSSQRQRIIERDGFRCGICGDEVALDDIHIDHIFPVSRGGGDNDGNLQVAHSKCNLTKGAKI